MNRMAPILDENPQVASLVAPLRTLAGVRDRWSLLAYQRILLYSKSFTIVTIHFFKVLLYTLLYVHMYI